MRQNIQFLSDDSLKGRQPGTFGEEVAAAFVASQMEEIGCLPAGENNTYYQPVKMVGMTARDGTSKLAFKVKEFQLTGKFGDDYVHSMDPLSGGTCKLRELGFGVCRTWGQCPRTQLGRFQGSTTCWKNHAGLGESTASRAVSNGGYAVLWSMDIQI